MPPLNEFKLGPLGICPIMSSTVGVPSTMRGPNGEATLAQVTMKTNCVGEECALWDMYRGGCGLKPNATIAEWLGRLTEAVQTLSKTAAESKNGK